MRFGSQEPTFRTAPQAARTDGPSASRMSELAGMALMPWQASLLDDWMAFSESGTWASGSCGLSVPRQNGKTASVAARIAYGMVAYNEWVVYTSHLQKTSTETFEILRSMFESKALRGRVREVKAAIGREEIVLNDGGRVKFLARTRNGGRGQHGDLWVVDEAQELTDEQQGSFKPLLAASRNPQTIYIGTPPDENAPGVVFDRLRARARSGGSSRLCWSEWSTSEVGDVSDKDRWYASNPSMGYQIKESTVADELTDMAPDIFARERLGWWSSRTAAAAIDRESWDGCRTSTPSMDGLVSYGVKFSHDGGMVVLACCDRPRDGIPHVELAEVATTAGGITWLADWIAPRMSRAAAVAVDGMGMAQQLCDMLKDAGVPDLAVMRPKAADMCSAPFTFEDSFLL